MKKTLEFMKEPINYICDPGHGWIAVPMEVIKELGIEDKISSCSYKRKGIAYLEEDCDAGLFVDVVKRELALMGVELKFNQRHQDSESIIRTFDRF